MNNNKLKQSNYKKSFFKCTDGSALVAFAFMVPAILVCMLVSIQHAQTMRTRARISEATNEASLAVIALNNKNVDDASVAQNRQLALNYINYFVYQKTSSDLVERASIDIAYNADKKEYYIAYRQTFDSPFSNRAADNGWGAQLNNTVSIGNKTANYGNTRKYDVSDSFDIAFITDFSGSATCQYNDTACNQYSGANNNNQRRLDYMKSAIVGIIENYKKYSDYHFALVPYDIGVPVASTPTSNRDLSVGYNCSVMYKMKGGYEANLNIDYNFWANKNIAYRKWSLLRRIDDNHLSDPYTKKIAYYYLDYYNYLYYSKILGPALGANSDADLVNRGLCIRRNVGSFGARLACGTNSSNYPLDPRNDSKLKTQYSKIVKLFDYMFSGRYPDVHYSFANTKTVDVDETLRTLFSGMRSNIIDFERPLAPPTTDYSPFDGMCQSPLYSNGLMSEDMLNMSHSDRVRRASEKLGAAIRARHLKRTFLIPFGSSNDDFLNEIRNADWKPGGGTDTITALLRTVPEIARGDSNNKIMIIITDGKDDSGADVLRDRFLDNHVCQRITEGLVSDQNKRAGYIAKAAKTAAIYYIKIDPSARNLRTDAEYESVYGKWFTKCMGGNKQFLLEAHDYQSLYEAITQIIEVETGHFINRN